MNNIKKFWESYKKFKWYNKILMFIPVIITVGFFLIFYRKKDTIKHNSIEKIQKYIKKDISKEEQQISNLNKQIEEEEKKQEEIEQNIEYIKSKMEKEIEKVNSINNPTASDINNLYSGFRNRT